AAAAIPNFACEATYKFRLREQAGSKKAKVKMQKYGHLVLVLDYSKAQSAPRQERRRLRVLTRVRIPSAIYTRRRWRVVRTSAFCLLPFAFLLLTCPRRRAPFVYGRLL